MDRRIPHKQQHRLGIFSQFRILVGWFLGETSASHEETLVLSLPKENSCRRDEQQTIGQV